MYHPESYWNEVVKKIAVRETGRRIAGDDEPYYRFKRKQFLKLLNKIDFSNKTVLEVGSGPGGNLLEIVTKSPKELHGVDISEEMITIAKAALAGKAVRLTKIDGKVLPFMEDYFDVSFTSTVLQHNTDEIMLKTIVDEICRVSKDDIYIFERIEKTVKGTDLCFGRPIKFYQLLSLVSCKTI